MVTSSSEFSLVFDCNGISVNQSWSSISLDVQKIGVVLNGTAATSTYDYKLHAKDTRILAVDAVSEGVTGSILFFGDPSTNTDSMEISVTGTNPTTCEVLLTFDGTANTPFAAPRKQDGFIAAVVKASQGNLLTGSPSPIASKEYPGQVRNQIQTGPGDQRLGATLFSAVLPTNDARGDLEQATYKADNFQHHSIDNDPKGADLSRMQAMTVFSRGLADDGAPPFIENPANPSPNPNPSPNSGAVDGAWIAQIKPWALGFGYLQDTTFIANAMSIPIAPISTSVIQPGPKWSYEAWIRPEQTARSNIVSFRKTPDNPAPGSVKPEFFLATSGSGLNKILQLYKDPGIY